MQQKTAALTAVATHLEQAREGVGIERADQPGNPLLELCCFSHLAGSELIGDLQHVSDNDLVVRRDTLMSLDRVGYEVRIRVSRLGLSLAVRRPPIRRIPGDGGPCKTDPELRRPCSALATLGFGLVFGVFLHQLQPIVGEGVEMNPSPLLQQLARHQSQRLACAVGFDRDEPERLTKLLGAHPALEGDGAELMSVKSRCQIAEYWIRGVRGHTDRRYLCPNRRY